MSRNIVITGASSLIGQAIAASVAGPEDRILLQCRSNSEACRRVITKARCAGRITRVDFTRQDELSAFCAEMKEVDVLVYAAACTRTDLLPNLSDDDIGDMIGVNIRALVAVCRAVLPAMMVRRKGVIVTVSSVAAWRGNRGQSVYAGTKGFVESFTRALAAEYGGRGIRANSVAPGAIDAGSLKELLAYAGDRVVQGTAAGRLGTPSDVAAAVAYLCSPQAAFVNGACLRVDGGCMTGV